MNANFTTHTPAADCSSTVRPAVVAKRRYGTWAAKLVVALAAIAGLTGLVQPGLAQPAVAQAYTLQGPDKVGFGRAVILFNRNDTLKIGLGGLPRHAPPGQSGLRGIRHRQGRARRNRHELLQPRLVQRIRLVNPTMGQPRLHEPQVLTPTHLDNGPEVHHFGAVYCLAGSKLGGPLASTCRAPL